LRRIAGIRNTIDLALVTPSLAAPSMVSHQPTVCHPLMTVVEQVVHREFSHTSSASDDSGIDKPEKISESPNPKSPGQSQINDKNEKSIDSYTLSSDVQAREGGPLDLDTFETNLGGSTSISEHSTSLQRTLTSDISVSKFLLLLQWRLAAQ